MGEKGSKETKENKDLSDSFEQTVKIRFAIHAGFFGCDSAGLVLCIGVFSCFLWWFVVCFFKMNIMPPPKVSHFSKYY